MITPLLTTTFNEILNDSTIDINTELLALINAYKGQSVHAKARAVVESDNPAAVTELQRIPGIVDYYDFTYNIYTAFSQWLEEWLVLVIGDDYGGDKKFISMLILTMSYMDNVNNLIDAANGTLNVAKSSFTSVNDLITGGITNINNDPENFSKDLKNAGKLIDLKDITNFGTPYGLMKSLISSNAVSLLQPEYKTVGIDVAEMVDTVNNNPGTALLPEIQKLIYLVSEQITDDKLSDVLLVMNVTTPNINTLADLLDMTKVFPNSYKDFNILDKGVLKPLFNQTGGVETLAINVSCESPISNNVMPIDQAIVNKSISNTFQQLKGVYDIDADQLADVIGSIEQTDGLDNINSLTRPIEPEIVDEIIDSISNGSAVNPGNDSPFPITGSYILTDFFGSIAGFVHIDTFTLLNNFNSIYNYSALESALDGLISDPLNIGPLTSAVNDVVSHEKYPAVATAHLDSLAQIQYEKTNLELADNDVFQPITRPGIALAFISVLPRYALRTDPKDVVDILERIAMDTLGGDSLLGAMIEARNLVKLDNIGIKTDFRV